MTAISVSFFCFDFFFLNHLFLPVNCIVFISASLAFKTTFLFINRILSPVNRFSGINFSYLQINLPGS